MNNYRTERRERNKLRLRWHFKSVCLPSTAVSDSSPEDESKQMLPGEMSDRSRPWSWIYPWLLFPLRLAVSVCPSAQRVSTHCKCHSWLSKQCHSNHLHHTQTITSQSDEILAGSILSMCPFFFFFTASIYVLAEDVQQHGHDPFRWVSTPYAQTPRPWQSKTYIKPSAV